MRFKSVDELPENWRKQIETDNNRATIRGGKQEPDRKATLDKAQGIPAFHKGCYLRVVVYRKGKQWDVDNAEIKAVQDAIVTAGIVEDDTVAHISRNSKEGVPCKRRDEEKTIIELIEVE